MLDIKSCSERNLKAVSSMLSPIGSPSWLHHAPKTETFIVNESHIFHAAPGEPWPWSGGALTPKCKCDGSGMSWTLVFNNDACPKVSVFLLIRSTVSSWKAFERWESLDRMLLVWATQLDPYHQDQNAFVFAKPKVIAARPLSSHGNLHVFTVYSYSYGLQNWWSITMDRVRMPP
jgi:hypothetical protein